MKERKILFKANLSNSFPYWPSGKTYNYLIKIIPTHIHTNKLLQHKLLDLNKWTHYHMKVYDKFVEETNYKGKIRSLEFLLHSHASLNLEILFFFAFNEFTERKYSSHFLIAIAKQQVPNRREATSERKMYGSSRYVAP